MSEQAKHTPGVWGTAHRKNADGMFSTEVFCEKGETIATLAWYPKDEGSGVTSTYREANARRIVQCVNNFDSLVEALHKIEAKAAPGQSVDIHAATDLLCDVWNVARAAIARTSLPA